MFSVCFSPDGAWLAAAGADNTIRLFETASRRERRVIQAHADWIMALAVSADGRHLASASRDRTARLFDSASGELEATYPDHGAPVCAVAFGEKDRRIYSGGRDRRIVAWSAADAKKLGEISGFDEEVTRLLVGDGQLFSASADRQVRQHALPDRKLVRTYTGHQDWVDSLAYHSPSRRLASGSHDGEVRIWNVEDGQLVTAFIAAPGHPRSTNP